jgi:hypothetical protein
MKKLIAAETVLYLVFMGMDLFSVGNSTPVKFAAILLLALSALDLREKTVSLALILTMIADVFLLVLNRWYAAGIACFLGVQILYAARLKVKDGSWTRILMFLLPIAAGLAVYTSYGFGLTEALAVAYITLFACNLVQAVGRAKRDPKRKWILFAAGLALFFCCDLCVGLHNMPGAGGEILQRFANVAMWGFYLPGQVLIRTSAYVEN